MAESRNQLVRGLPLTDTTSLVIGTIIGSGVFLKTSVMAQQVGTPTLVLAAWVAAGVVLLAGGAALARRGADLRRARGHAPAGRGRVRLPAYRLRRGAGLPLRLDAPDRRLDRGDAHPRGGAGASP